MMVRAHGRRAGIATIDEMEIDELVVQQVEETVVTDNTGATYTVDVRDGTIFDLTLTDSVTFSFTGGSSTPGGNAFTLILTQDGTGSRTATWPGSVVWTGGSAPTLTAAAGSTDTIAFYTPDDGSTWYGIVGGQNFS